MPKCPLFYLQFLRNHPFKNDNVLSEAETKLTAEHVLIRSKETRAIYTQRAAMERSRPFYQVRVTCSLLAVARMRVSRAKAPAVTSDRGNNHQWVPSTRGNKHLG